MSRSNYSDELYDKEVNHWRRKVNRAIRSKRGQKFLAELAAALDAMPNRRLITGTLATEAGECCALGAVCLARGIDADEIPQYDPKAVGNALGISEAMAAEIAYLNDEDFDSETPQQRWSSMREWVAKQIKEHNQ